MEALDLAVNSQEILGLSLWFLLGPCLSSSMMHFHQNLYQLLQYKIYITKSSVTADAPKIMNSSFPFPIPICHDFSTNPVPQILSSTHYIASDLNLQIREPHQNHQLGIVPGPCEFPPCAQELFRRKLLGLGSNHARNCSNN